MTCICWGALCWAVWPQPDHSLLYYLLNSKISEGQNNGLTCLVTASCPRQYPREAAERKRLGIMIPEDFAKADFVDNLRRLVNVNSNRTLLKAYCVDKPHKRFRKSKQRRERHIHLAFLMDAPFAHKKLAEEMVNTSNRPSNINFERNLLYLITQNTDCAIIDCTSISDGFPNAIINFTVICDSFPKPKHQL